MISTSNLPKWISQLMVAFICLGTMTAQNLVEVRGTVVDQSDEPIPFAAVGIPSKYVGTSTNDEGKFSLELSEENYSDLLEVSSIGYATYKIKVQEYIRWSVVY